MHIASDESGIVVANPHSQISISSYFLIDEQNIKFSF